MNRAYFMKHLSRIAGLCLLTSSTLFFSSCTTTNSRPDLVWTEDGHQYGIASFYDDHGDRTANGELFNMHALTAAHPSIALNSLVEVKNLANGKTVTVRVNDRLPPIHDGRVIDLSVAAFRRLAPLQDGLINVELRVLEYGNNKYVLVNRSAPAGKMYLASAKTTKSKSSSKPVTRFRTSPPRPSDPVEATKDSKDAKML